MENELVELVMEDTRDRMAKVIEHARSEFATVRTGRASSAIIENLMVEYYGTDTALKQLANFSVPEPRLLVVSPFDKGAMASIEKAISNADLGLNPSNDGVVIRLTFPSLTEERRKSFVKIVHARPRTDEWRYGDADVTPAKNSRPWKRTRASRVTTSSTTRRSLTDDPRRSGRRGRATRSQGARTT